LYSVARAHTNKSPLVGAQAKRYDKDNTFLRLDIQAFVGALQGALTSRGVFRDHWPVLTRCPAVRGKRRHAPRHVGVQVRERFELKQIDEETLEESASRPTPDVIVRI
jgi:restriction system protein